VVPFNQTSNKILKSKKKKKNKHMEQLKNKMPKMRNGKKRIITISATYIPG
jgi:hypothetical protein